MIRNGIELKRVIWFPSFCDDSGDVRDEATGYYFEYKGVELIAHRYIQRRKGIFSQYNNGYWYISEASCGGSLGIKVGKLDNLANELLLVADKWNKLIMMVKENKDRFLPLLPTDNYVVYI